MTPQPQPLVLHAPPLTSYGGYRLGTNNLAPAQVSARPYFETDKLRALAVYAETGNTYEVERQTGIGRGAVRGWIEQDSSQDLISELRASIRYREGYRLSSLVSRSLDAVERALDQGDAVVLKDGRTIYKPMSYRDAVIGTSILIDKWMMISGSLVNENALMGKMDDLSKQLAGLGGSLATGAPSPSLGSPIMADQGENLIG